MTYAPNNQTNFAGNAGYFGVNVGSGSATAVWSRNTGVGVTTDPTKSGLVATFSGLTLGTIPCEKLGDFYIRY